MKKLICIVISIVMMLSLCAPAFAIDIVEGERMSALEAVAYLDLSEVDEAMKSKVIAAREEIIFSKSWVVEGRAEVVDKDGNVIRELPNFLDLFPADWDVPVYEATEISVAAQNALSISNSRSFAGDLFNGRVMLRTPSDTQNTSAFFTTNTYYSYAGVSGEYLYDWISTEGIYGSPASTGEYNVGYSNASSGASLLYEKNLNNSEALRYYPTSKFAVAIRASSYNYTGYWTMIVSAYDA